MYNDATNDERDGTPVTRSGDASSESGLHVVDLYARLAAERAVEARWALRHSHSADQLLAQSAQALEDAAGTLVLLSDSYAGDRSEFAERLGQQASALVALAAQFEQAADLARHERGQQ